MDATIEIQYCTICDGALTLLGALGNCEWFRCRNCGVEMNINLEDEDGDIIASDEDISAITDDCIIRANPNAGRIRYFAHTDETNNDDGSSRVWTTYFLSLEDGLHFAAEHKVPLMWEVDGGELAGGTGGIITAGGQHWYFNRDVEAYRYFNVARYFDSHPVEAKTK